MPKQKRAVYFLRHYPSIPFFNKDLPDFHRARYLMVSGLSSEISEEITAIISESFRVASLARVGDFSSELLIAKIFSQAAMPESHLRVTRTKDYISLRSQRRGRSAHRIFAHDSTGAKSVRYDYEEGKRWNVRSSARFPGKGRLFLLITSRVMV